MAISTSILTWHNNGIDLDVLINVGQNEQPSVIGFLDWQASIDSPTLKLLTQLTLNISLARYVQLVGNRDNEETCSDASRPKFLNMFFAFNHSIYREV